MRTTGRPAALLPAALLLVGLAAFSACAGAEPESGPRAPVAEAAPSPTACVDEPAPVGEVTGDMPPHYVENHAFQQRLRLCDDDLARTRAEAERTREGLGQRGALTAAEVVAALAELGHEPGSTTVADEGGVVRFTVLVAPGCLDGTVAADEVRVEARGLFAEGGCVKPVGGH